MNKIPKISVAGAGYWGENLIRNFRSLGALAIVCDENRKTLAGIRKRYSGIGTTPHFEELLSPRAPQGIVIATPAKTHFELAQKALAAGKDVFVEKPLSLCVSEGHKLVRIARFKKKVLMVGHILEYHPAISKLRGLIRKGRIGELRFLYSHRLNFGKIRKEENILWSFAPHDISAILRLIGKIPRQVSAWGSAYLRPSVADVTSTELDFGGKLKAYIFVSWLNPVKEQKLVVVGSREMIVFDDVTKEMISYSIKSGKIEQELTRDKGKRIPYPSGEPLRLECKAFLRAMRTRTSPLTDGKSGLKVLRVLEAAQKSMTARGKPVSLRKGQP